MKTLKISLDLSAELRAKRLPQTINQVAELYQRLVLVAALSGAGKTAALREAAHETQGHYINISLELSQRLLDLTERQRAVKVNQLLEEIISVEKNQIVLLDNLELLFDASIKQDPLRLLQGLSRHRTVVAAWNGTIVNDRLTYASPGHPEYRSYPAAGLTVLSIHTGNEHTA